MSTQTFTCPICGEIGIASSLPMAGIGTLWRGECTNSTCSGMEATEILGSEDDEFPVEEWEENYDKF